MPLSLFHTLGGLGLFLLGMSVMTQGLRTLADEQMRSLLARFTRSPASGVFTGAVATAIIQSSSATTVAAVGFVEAGLLEFSQALGVIFGANIGTTITGWFIALFGFKLNLGDLLLPVVFAGVLMRLIGRPRLSAAGSALAGFGLVFVGIAMLQEGMLAAQEIVTPDSFPPDTIFGRLLLVLMGVALTIVTQSSSAGVAAALVAVNAGTISLSQAAAMVIGMDLGTTVTAALATVGGKVPARRTGFAHVIYNVMTAIGAFLLLSPYMAGVSAVWPGLTQSDPEIVLVGFHTFFNTLGVVAVLPFTRRFAALLIRLFPERGNPLTRRLDPLLISSRRFALDAVHATLIDVTRGLLSHLDIAMRPDSSGPEQDLEQLEEATEDCRDFLGKLNINVHTSAEYNQYLAALHTLDHQRRLLMRLKQKSRIQKVRSDAPLSEMSDTLLASIRYVIAELPPPVQTVEQMRDTNQMLKRGMKEYRRLILERTATQEISTRRAATRMDTARWLRRVGYHVWRIVFHLSSEAEVSAGAKPLARTPGQAGRSN